ncbi:MAG: YchF/TatD family DNA exonuclease [bacterium]|nr:YchF/TatD family DNA exonuclease [bacterium]
MLIDTHVHLNDSKYKLEQEEIIKKALLGNISYLIDIGSNLTSSKASIDLSCKYQNVYSAVGIHPHEAKTFNGKSIDSLKDLSKNKKVVAIGEIGLDYHYNFSTPTEQKKAFIEQIKLASSLNLPLIIHAREATKDILHILEQHGLSLKGVFHAFSGDKEILNWAISNQYYISISGMVTFKNSNLSSLVKEIPMDKFLIETDSPYLAPHPMRGKKNQPAYLTFIAKKLAEVMHLSLEDISRITTLNAKQLFNLEPVVLKDTYTYKIRNSLYVNLTNRCTNNCYFCIRNKTYFIKGHYLKLEKEPTVENIISEIGEVENYKEIVFCGLGEPFLRYNTLIKIAKYLKNRGAKIRINTNGQANLICSKNIAIELKGTVDALSISLNASTSDTYQKISQCSNHSAFEAIIGFVKECKKYIPEITLTFLELPTINIEECKKLAQNLRVEFKIRKYDVVG